MSVCTSFSAIRFLTRKMLHHGGLVPGTCRRRRDAVGFFSWTHRGGTRIFFLDTVAVLGFFSKEVNSSVKLEIYHGQIKN